MISEITGGATLVYFASRYSLKSLLVPSYAWAIICALSINSLLILLDFFPAHYLKYLFVLSLLNSIFSIHQSLLTGYQKFNASNLLNTLQIVIVSVWLYISFVYSGIKNLNVYFIALYLSYSVVVLIGGFSLLRVKETQKEKARLKDLVTYGIINQIAHVLQFISFRLSFFLLYKSNGSFVTGVYSNAVQIAESVWLVSNSIAMVQYGKIASMKNTKEAQQMTLLLTKFCLLFSVIALITIFILPATFFSFLFGKDFIELKNIIVWLAPGVLFYNFLLIGGHYFSGIGKFKLNTYSVAFGFIVTIIGNALFYDNYSIIKAGIISSLSYTVTGIFVFALFLKESDLSLTDLLPNKNDIKQIKNWL